ncbi:hypothetical protein JHW45_16750 [Paracoccus stylophorae]|uniref:Acetyl-CoA hydrolase/transferase C-terminal domain-containing protein n=1 Tax=Paracoccus stylophorae TaxID=659350 RepID=A0ABY7SUQ6_9RHOB|nr:acetyl-CoA hydrolase/transferase C-terminal domain-containing protein [Paracoccus stylophorae]WCR10663.1 hypothetical protein JHW45_16750 [Paracoccus stylophorae]
MIRLDDPDAAARQIVERTVGEIRLAVPLGLGKPVSLVNALVRRACDDPGIRLSIFTALTLERPRPSSDLERRFLAPAMDRLFGAYPAVLYVDLLRRGKLPDNITVNEFFFQAGNWLDVNRAQQSYISVNYTDALDVLIARRPNVIAQLVPEREGRVSLSSNTDISADLFRLRAEGRMDFLAVAEINPQLPFLQGEGAVLDCEDFALILDQPAPFELFSAVKRPVNDASHAIGLHVSRLVKDGGTLQIGIGSVGDAVANALRLRHQGRADGIQQACPFPVRQDAGGRFDQGLYAVTEMLVGGLLALFQDGIVKRKVDGRAIHAGFFVESRDFYRSLREMPEDRRDLIGMMPVSFTNQIRGDEAARRAARRDARFVNEAMKVSLLGDVMSDSVADGQVVSGVGGQYDFVAQAFALPGAHAIIALPATRRSGARLDSNICWQVDSVTIPRHLRDIVVTEYGIADLRGRSDAGVIARLIAIADSRFQPDLIARAMAAGKLPRDFRLPDAAQRNLPDTVSGWLDPWRADLPAFPLGTDFSEIERDLLPALRILERLSPSVGGKARLALAALRARPHPQEGRAMTRMGFAPGFPTSLTALALRGALRLSAEARPRTWPR